ncbi:hypothetical protein VF04_35060 [Nostoc linckia z7]|uniref:Portal protein n=1 Tax=Nostoc linckia z7 TaxID=1628745 RepID=A0ABX4KBZ9_NOSLI|nr:phage portal protein [Nostoc linckia]PHJ53867.1 hypothetical protein VF02_37090 [Nostoc linckia z1]PHJ59283.1 hypothetical protein VF05_32335 [Nostoc linckia z3]PHJ63678.1 hypothetical protein VF03_30210 [Nostoc linckia z2]PHJ73860.1 hypothetical protein VF06_35680 [Nostoc linckia z4]PHJ87199.1 hypothetical protein VF04_35060 [Nostoc linckia z7]
MKLPKIFGRSYSSPDPFPEKVFVNDKGWPSPYAGLPGYDSNGLPQWEYSDMPPAMLGRGFDIEAYIDDILYGTYGEQNFINLFYCVPEIFAPVHEIASRVSDAIWELRKVRKSGGKHDDETIYTDAAFNRLFSNPNPLQPFKDFIYMAVCYELLTGKSFIYANRPAILPNEWRSTVNWWVLPAQNVIIDHKQGVNTYAATDVKDFVSRYRVTDNGAMRDFEPDKVLPLVRLSLQFGNDIRKTRSPLSGAGKAIKNLLLVYAARGAIYFKQGPQGIFVSAKTDEDGTVPLTSTEKANFLADLQANYGVTHGRGLYAVSNQAMNYLQVGSSIQDLLPFDETQTDAVAIYAALRVPRHLVPTKDQSTFSNANADLKSFYSDVIIPMAQRYAEAFTNFFNLEAERKYINADFSHVDILQENKKERADVDKINTTTNILAWQNGIKTLNDCLVASGADESTNPLYGLYIFDMTPEQLETVKNALNLKSVAANSSQDNQEESTNTQQNNS